MGSSNRVVCKPTIVVQILIMIQEDQMLFMVFLGVPIAVGP